MIAVDRLEVSYEDAPGLFLFLNCLEKRDMDVFSECPILFKVYSP